MEFFFVNYLYLSPTLCKMTCRYPLNVIILPLLSKKGGEKMSVADLQSCLAQARNGFNEHRKELDTKLFSDAWHGLNLAEKAIRKLQSKQDQSYWDEGSNSIVDVDPDQLSDSELLD
jgi:hypothetical protein